MKTKPTFHRQRLLMALLEGMGGQLTKLDLQKLLFIFTEEHKLKKRAYEFIPYHYGCYSFQAQSDLKTLENYGLIHVDKHTNLIRVSEQYKSEGTIQKPEQEALSSFFAKYQGLKGNKLIAYVYENYPYYTLNSKIAHQYFIPPQKTQPQLFIETNSSVFTIGYEGITFERYVNNLIENGIDVLCDVRKNPFSMKFGFSKNMLKHTLENIGIKYIHLPELGIESENRQELNTPEDYRLLFVEYEETTLQSPKSISALKSLYELAGDKKIALTCFEKDIEFCHRGIIAKKLKEKYDLNTINI